jgi:hypothetical protein
MNSAADAIKKRLEGKGLTESDEKYFRDYMSDLEKQMKRAQKWERTINSKTQTEELRAAFAELEQQEGHKGGAAEKTEYLISSVPPRGSVENIARKVDNKHVANGGGANNQNRNMEELKKMLGLPADADDAAVLSAIRSLKAQGAEAKTKTEEVAAECEKHKKALADHKEKSADAFIKRLQKDGTIAPKDEERAKAARTLFMADPEQAETLFCGLRAAHSEVVGDEVRANRVTEASASDYSNKSLEELLNEN